MDEIVCLQVRYPDGSVVWESIVDYRRNPPAGTFLVREKPKYPEPIIK